MVAAPLLKGEEKGENLNRPKSGGLLSLPQHQEENSRQVLPKFTAYGHMQIYALQILVVEF